MSHSEYLFRHSLVQGVFYWNEGAELVQEGFYWNEGAELVQEGFEMKELNKMGYDIM